MSTAGTAEAMASAMERYAPETVAYAMERMTLFLGQDLVDRGFTLDALDADSPPTAENARLAWENIEYYSEVRVRLTEILTSAERMAEIDLSISEFLLLMEKSEEAGEQVAHWARYYRDTMLNPFGYISTENTGAVFTPEGQDVLRSVLRLRLGVVGTDEGESVPSAMEA